MTYEATLEMIPGEGLSSNLPPTLSNVYPTSTSRDQMKLYPLWHFIFYFNKPIGDTVGVEVGVWGDTKEIAYSQDYGYLGGPIPTATPQATNEQTSNKTGQNSLFQLQSESAFALIFGAAIAILIGSYLIIRRKIRH